MCSFASVTTRIVSMATLLHRWNEVGTERMQCPQQRDPIAVFGVPASQNIQSDTPLTTRVVKISHWAEHIRMPYHQDIDSERGYILHYPCSELCLLGIFKPALEPGPAMSFMYAYALW